MKHPLDKFVYCPCCGEFKSATNFYGSKKTKSGLEHLGCKSCILDMATDYDKKNGIRTDNKEKKSMKLTPKWQSFLKN